MTRDCNVIHLDRDDARMWLSNDCDQRELLEAVEAVADELDADCTVIDEDGDLFAFFAARSTWPDAALAGWQAEA